MVTKRQHAAWGLLLAIFACACQSAQMAARQTALRALRGEAGYVRIAPGAFLMGAPESEPRARRAQQEAPSHRVVLTCPFEIGRFEVTQRQWEAVMNANPSAFKGPELPVTNVSWKDVQEFLHRLNRLDPEYAYRLPTEAEWEYACRAGGSEAAESEAALEASLRQRAWYEANSLNRPHAVAQLQPNGWGLYDMQGNVWEWVEDWYDLNYYRRSPPENPPGPPTGQSRVLRGGSWQSTAQQCRATARNASLPVERNNLTGFRLVRVPRS